MGTGWVSVSTSPLFEKSPPLSIVKGATTDPTHPRGKAQKK